MFATIANSDDRTRPLLRDVMGAQSICWFTLAVAIMFDGSVAMLVWSVQGALLLWMSQALDDVRLRYVSLGLIAVGLLGAVDHIAVYVPDALFTSDGGVVALAQIASLFVVASLLLRRDTDTEQWAGILGMLLLGVANLMLLAVISREAGFEVRRRVDPPALFGAVHFTYSLLWSLYAAILLVVGIVRKIPAARYFAIGLFGVTIVKMMTIDVWQLSELRRMVAFVGLGALLLICSLMYNRFRELIVGGAPVPRVDLEADPQPRRS
jgi:uncharacterized membrane protein